MACETFDRAEERKELQKHIDHYQERADYYEYEYQVNGMASQLNAWMRNQRMADALRAALNGSTTLDRYHGLRLRVMELDVHEPLSLMKSVKYLQGKIEKGEL